MIIVIHIVIISSNSINRNHSHNDSHTSKGNNVNNGNSHCSNHSNDGSHLFNTTCLNTSCSKLVNSLAIYHDPRDKKQTHETNAGVLDR